MSTARVIADSVNPAGQRITTIQLRYWRSIHAELMTHRAFSRNASSSRAIPVRKMLAQVWSDPAGPEHWGSNQPGMQAGAELTGWRLRAARATWKWAGRAMCAAAWAGMKLGLHKQVVNRMLEPWQFISVVLTSTEWDNFFALRDHPAAQPEIRTLAVAMRAAMQASTPRPLEWGQWHLPYVHPTEGDIRASVARCARVSYLSHGQSQPRLEDDIALHDRLMRAEPAHASPAEHQAQATPGRFANFNGWASYRHLTGL